jgi:glycerate 2-kinase
VTARVLEPLEADLRAAERVRVVAAGKAALGMGTAAAQILGRRLTAGLMTAKVGSSQDLDPRWLFIPGSHPVPSPASEEAGRGALRLAAEVQSDADLLLVCLSGGASAMLAVPAPGLSLEDKAATTRVMLRAGLDIGAINIVRRHLSAIKGGQLAAAAQRTITLAISDVSGPVEDDPAAIGSGPTVGDATTFGDAIRILAARDLLGAIPSRVADHLRAGEQGLVAGPVRPDDARLTRSAYWIAASRHDAMRAAADTARRVGYEVTVRPGAVAGSARAAAAMLLDEAADLPRPACFIASGETTVHVTGGGRGGRNQELAVASLARLAAIGTCALASIGTDGVDGPTDAAGAFVDYETWPALGPDAGAQCETALAQNDTYPLLDRLGALVRSGPTGTNVGDLQILLLG